MQPGVCTSKITSDADISGVGVRTQVPPDFRYLRLTGFTGDHQRVHPSHSRGHSDRSTLDIWPPLGLLHPKAPNAPAPPHLLPIPPLSANYDPSQRRAVLLRPGRPNCYIGSIQHHIVIPLLHSMDAMRHDHHISYRDGLLYPSGPSSGIQDFPHSLDSPGMGALGRNVAFGALPLPGVGEQAKPLLHNLTW